MGRQGRINLRLEQDLWISVLRKGRMKGCSVHKISLEHGEVLPVLQNTFSRLVYVSQCAAEETEGHFAYSGVLGKLLSIQFLPKSSFPKL